MRGYRSWLVCGATVLFLSACADAGTAVSPLSTLQGKFALVQVQGAPLPIVLRRIGDAGGADGIQHSCTEYLAGMNLDITSSGAITKVESRRLTCDDARADLISVSLVSGTASTSVEGWRFDFPATDNTLATRYFGSMDGGVLTIVRRETDVIVAPPGQGGTPAPMVGIDLSQLVFNRL